MTGNSRLVVTGGSIHTMDDLMPLASAIVAEAGRIVDVRPAGAPPPDAVPGEERLDLRGGALLPGLHDAHTHLVHWGLRFVRPELSTCRSLADALAVVAERHESTPGLSPLIAEGWDESGWPEPRFPTREDLDAVSRERPLVMRRVCGHVAVANGAALARVPATSQVDAVAGLLVEDAVMGLAGIFPPSPEELDEALAAAQQSYHSLGVTAVHDISSPEHLKAFARAEARGDLRIGITSILTRPHLDILGDAGIGAGWRRGRVTLWGVKLFTDGSLGARTAALHEPYADAADKRGLLLIEPAELVDCVRRAETAGIPLAVHAIGDRAVDTVLDAFEAGLPPVRSRLGHRIEHLEMVSDRGLARMERLGLVASMQPNFVARWGWPGGLYESRLGAARTGAMNPMRRVLDAGVRLIFGSDAMPAGVLYGIQAAVLAPHEAQRLSWRQAVLAATREAARAGGSAEAGKLMPGCRADFTLLARDPAGGSPPAEWGVSATIVGGEVVWRNPLADRANASPVSG